MSRNKLYLLVIMACLIGYAWIAFSYHHYQEEGSVCLLKHITGIACPSCGSTRALLLLMKGDLLGSLHLNPIGLLLAIILSVSPCWIAFDLMLNTSTVWNFYINAEAFLKKRSVAIPLMVLVLVNWWWNIQKGL